MRHGGPCGIHSAVRLLPVAAWVAGRWLRPSGSLRWRPLLAALVLAAGCQCGRANRPGAPAASGAPIEPSDAGVFDVPRRQDAITVDGKLFEKSWRSALRSPLLVDAHGRSAPFTQLFATADDDTLYLALYVGDADVRSQDEARLDVGPLHIVATPRGATAPPGVQAAVDTDATIDDPAHDDEEWIAEIAIPWSLLGTRAPAVRAFRIDVGRREPHALAWPPEARAVLRFAGR